MRKIKDHFYYKAKKENYPARSVYKLQEIDRKYNIIKKGSRVLDLGCSPGSWSKYCCNKVGDKGLVVGIDKQTPNIHPIGINWVFIQEDVLNMYLGKLKQISERFDVVLSDLAPSTTGTKEVDQARSLQLAESAYGIAEKILKPGGCFVCKLFQGPDTKCFLEKMRKRFKLVRTVKPAGSRKESFEVFLIGYGN